MSSAPLSTALRRIALLLVVTTSASLIADDFHKNNNNSYPLNDPTSWEESWINGFPDGPTPGADDRIIFDDRYTLPNTISLTTPAAYDALLIEGSTVTAEIIINNNYQVSAPAGAATNPLTIGSGGIQLLHSVGRNLTIRNLIADEDQSWIIRSGNVLTLATPASGTNNRASLTGNGLITISGGLDDEGNALAGGQVFLGAYNNRESGIEATNVRVIASHVNGYGGAGVSITIHEGAEAFLGAGGVYDNDFVIAGSGWIAGVAANYDKVAKATIVFSSKDGGALTGTITLAGNASFASRAGATLAGVIQSQNNAAHTLTLSANSGTNSLQGVNTFTGDVYFGGGLNINNSSALGVGPKTIYGNTAKASLFLEAGSENIDLSSNLAIGILSSGTGITNVQGDNVIRGNVSAIGSDNVSLKFTVDGGTLTFKGQIDTTGSTRNKTLELGGSYDGFIDGNIVNGTTYTMALTKSGTGTWTLSGANTYTGATSVAAGTLVLKSGASLTGSAVTVRTNSILAHSGTITGKVTVQDSASLYVGGNNTAGKGIIQGGLDLADTSIVYFDIAGLTRGAEDGTGYDALDIHTSLDFDGTFQIRLTDTYQPLTGDTFRLLDFSSVATNRITNSGHTLQYTYATKFEGYTFDWDSSLFLSSGIITLLNTTYPATVPEPQRSLFILMGFASLITRRQRRC